MHTTAFMAKAENKMGNIHFGENIKVRTIQDIILHDQILIQMSNTEAYNTHITNITIKTQAGPIVTH